MAQRLQHRLAKLPPLESDRINFKVVKKTKKGASFAKQLLIDGDVAFFMAFTDEQPDDRTVYEAYLTKLSARQPIERHMLKSLNNEQLGLVEAWLTEKSKDYGQRLGEEAATVVALLAQDITRAADLAMYEPTSVQMIEMLHQMAQSLDRKDAGKAAQKLRTAGNFIPRKD